jgi:hypothetical protein
MNSVQCEAAHSFCDCCELSSCWIGSPLARPDDKFLLYLNSEDVLSRRPWARVMWENKEQALSSTLPFEDLAYKNLDDSFYYVLNSVHKLVNPFICMGRVASVYSHSILKCYQGAYISSPLYITHQFASRAFCSCLLDSMFTCGGNRTYSFVTEFINFALESWNSSSKYITVGFFQIRHSSGVYFRNSGIINVCCLLVIWVNNWLITWQNN